MELNDDLNQIRAAFQKWKSIGVRAKEKVKSHEVTINTLNRQLQLSNEKLAESERSLRQKEELLKQYRSLLKTYSSVEDKQHSIIRKRDAAVEELQHFKKMKLSDERSKDDIGDTATVKIKSHEHTNEIHALQQRLLQTNSKIQKITSERVAYEKFVANRMSAMELVHKEDLANQMIELSKRIHEKFSGSFATAREQIKIQNQSKQENSSAIVTTGDVVIVLDSEEE